MKNTCTYDEQINKYNIHKINNPSYIKYSPAKTTHSQKMFTTIHSLLRCGARNASHSEGCGPSKKGLAPAVRSKKCFAPALEIQATLRRMRSFFTPKDLVLRRRASKSRSSQHLRRTVHIFYFEFLSSKCKVVTGGILRSLPCFEEAWVSSNPSAKHFLLHIAVRSFSRSAPQERAPFSKERGSSPKKEHNLRSPFFEGANPSE